MANKKTDITKEELDRLHKMVPPDYYDKGYSKNLLQKYWHEKRKKVVRDLLAGHDGDLLDLGCHGGWLTNVIDSHTSGKTYAIDLHADAVDYASKKYPHIEFQAADMEEPLPFEDNRFDIITSFDVLEHVPNLESISKEIRRVAKPGAHFIMGVPHETLLFKAIWLVWTKMKGEVWDDVHVNEFTNEYLDKVFPPEHYEKVLDTTTHHNMWRLVKYRIR